MTWAPLAATPAGRLRVHALLPVSYTNGPGRRTVLWVQGCTLACPGCFNPETHPFAGGAVAIDDVFAEIVAAGTGGLTVSGGEPLQQRRALTVLLRRVRAETDLSVLLFSGYSWSEIQALPGGPEVVSLVDVLVAGRYRQEARTAAGLRGSSNKTVHLLTGRHTLADIDAVPAAEVIIDADGGLVLTGIDPLRDGLLQPTTST